MKFANLKGVGQKTPGEYLNVTEICILFEKGGTNQRYR
jgi:hypothetical protein